MSAATFAKRFANDAQNIKVLDSVLNSLMNTNVASNESVPATDIEAVTRSMVIRLLISCLVNPIICSIGWVNGAEM